MRKLLIIVGSILAFLILAIILIPILFKDRILREVQTEVNKSVNANVNFDPDDFSLSLLKDFPNLTVGLKNLSVTGKEMFEGDTLFATKDFSLEVDIVAIIKSEPLRIKGIILDQPTINILVLEDGSANYDIVVPSDETDTTTTEESDMQIGIDHWEIKNGNISYYDQSADMAMSIIGLNHTGKGDFSQTVFDMVTKTTADDFSFAYDEDVYVAHKTLEINMILGMDLDAMKFKFNETSVRMNEFKLNFDGFFAMPEEDIDMDVKFFVEDTQFKSVLSLVPGMYADGFESLETKGEFDFKGFAKGTYGEDKLPAFSINLSVNDAYVKSPDVPLPVQNISLDLLAKSETGDLKDGLLEIKNFGLTIDKDRFTANAVVNNFDAPSWDLNAQGALNLDVISRIEPTTDYSIGGIVKADITSKGNYADVEQENYQNLNTSGTLELNNFFYSTTDLPDFKISQANLNFNPQFVEMSQMEGNFGKSDFKVTGQLSNYIAYAIKENAKLEGQMSLTSQLLDVNEMMGSSEEETTTEEDTTSMELVLVPENIDFTFNADVQQIVYDNFVLKNAKGKIRVNNQILTMDPLRFDMLEGSINMAGNYNTQDEDNPIFDFNLGIVDVSIPETFKNVVTVQKFVPVAEKMTGKFSTDFAIQGIMTQEMMPDLPTLSGSGIVKIKEAAVVDSKIIKGVTSLSKLDNTNTINLKDITLKAEIKDGKLGVEPFDIDMGKYKATIDGTTAFDGNIAYNLKLNVPTGSVGQAANQALSGLLGTDVKAVGSSVNLNFNVTGTYDDPNIKLGKTTTEGGQSVAGSAKTAVKEKITEETDKLKEEAEAKIEAAKDSAKNELERRKKLAEEEARKKAEEEKAKLKEKAKNKVKDIFGGGR
ncbi:AsmA-like C-terminal region-containing protein [Marivirga sp. S37H4]|uniref:AsmA-like C-terminal region-containing protein n=1 Tax=Marivirga aurantiaca TaxID=2802615 RepID=A0A935CAF7_9BACT|nr:AsmA-like C-terminal region-containing protein [Marivirga aurantiaca]MBK6266172.1 AsmA-like C-terminal region-containing protein [Marivirga aurantiaca]